MDIKVLCLGDIVGKPGRRILSDKLSELVRQNEIDCVIANAENVAGGSGITPQIYEKLLKYGINLITLGDHTYRRKEIIPTLETSDVIARPANFSRSAAGHDFAIYKTPKGASVAVISVIGRIFMKPAECPFQAADNVISKVIKQAELVFVDMHAEATSEKIAMGYHLDGRVSCIFGTHTHVVTADEKILSKGTGYITDIGMTGAHKSVLGRGVDNVLKSFRTQMPFPFNIADGDVKINGIIVTVDSNNKNCSQIERISVTE
jgi:hypothetical protein